MRRDSSPSTLLAPFRDDVGALGFSPGGRTQSAVRTEGTTRNNVYVQPEVSIEPSSGSGISLGVRLRMMALMHRFNEIRLPSSKEEMQHKDL